MTDSATEETPTTSAETPGKAPRPDVEGQAAALYLRGASGEEIAAAVGMKSRAGTRAAERGMARALQAPPEASRALDVSRANAAIAALWPRVEAGQPEAASALAALLTVRAQLLGLTGGPAQEDASAAEGAVAEPAPKSGGRSRGKSSDSDQLSLDA